MIITTTTRIIIINRNSATTENNINPNFKMQKTKSARKKVRKESLNEDLKKEGEEKLMELTCSAAARVLCCVLLLCEDFVT